jgi:hypothetical protein
LPPAERKIGDQAEGREKAEQREERKIDKATAQLMKALGVDEETAQSMIADAKAKSSAKESTDEQIVAGQ